MNPNRETPGQAGKGRYFKLEEYRRETPAVALVTRGKFQRGPKEVNAGIYLLNPKWLASILRQDKWCAPTLQNEEA